MARRFFVCISLLLPMTGCADLEEATSPSFEPERSARRLCANDSEPDAAVAIEDKRLKKQLQQAADRLIAAEAFTPSKTLIDQLKRKTVKLKIPEPDVYAYTPAEIYQKAGDSVLVFAAIYKCQKCSEWHSMTASGFVITKDGKAATNYHVIEGEYHTMIAMNRRGDAFAVKSVLAANEADDVAIVQLDGDTEFLPLPVVPAVNIGEPVITISHPDDNFYMLTSGVTSRMASFQKEGQSVRRLCVTAEYAKGSSGAPVMNRHGQVVGIVASTESVYYNQRKKAQKDLQMVLRFCVPTSALLNLVESG